MKINTGKSKYIYLFQGAILLINVFSVLMIAYFVYDTTQYICDRYEARAFIDNVDKVPRNPLAILVLCIAAMLILTGNFLIRMILSDQKKGLKKTTLIIDAFVCAFVIILLDFNEKGLIMLLCANMITYVQDKKKKVIFIGMTILGYLIADYNLLSIYMKLYNVAVYARVYPYETQQVLFSMYNVVTSLNIILFIIYCIYVINMQSGVIEEVNRLYQELQVANNQLQEYANMSERMAQTKERNRLAREIHDTLGHTLTGLVAGLDACMALIEISKDQTKQQLEFLAQVGRDGIKDVRRSVNELRPDALERLSLEVAIKKMIEEMCQLSEVEIFFETNNVKLKFDEDEENAIYRIVQESITNAMRHGKASKIWVSFEKKDGELLLVIKDNGIGCEKIVSGFGTRHIVERIEMLKGTVEFNGENGFTVTAHVPIRWGEDYD